MSMLFADPTGGLFWQSERSGALVEVATEAERPYRPCAAESELLCACQHRLEVECLRRDTLKPVRSFPALPAMSAMCVSPCGKYLYQLSSEADCVHTRLLATGELLHACPAGVYPRDMKLDEAGKHLLVAGGASGELLLLSAPDLRLVWRMRLPGVVCACDFLQGRLAVLCAVENGDIQTALMTLLPPRRAPELIDLTPGQPGGLCAAGSGMVAMGALRGLSLVSTHRRRVMWTLPSVALPACLQQRGGVLLVSDTLDGSVVRVPVMQPSAAQTLFVGGEAQAAYV